MWMKVYANKSYPCQHVHLQTCTEIFFANLAQFGDPQSINFPTETPQDCQFEEILC